MISEEHKINFDSLKLTELAFVEKDYVQQQDFQFGSISGIAEMIGFQIILFRKSEGAKNSCLSIDWGEDEHPIILEIAQKVLAQLNAKIALKDKLSDLEKYFGKADFTDNLYADSNTYHYLNKEKNSLYSFGVPQSLGITRISLIHDAEIVQERIDTFK